ncbi:GNAT family N-acetyltransferase [Aspergillus alliaceus]|uniref:GNAT family N-acetyltransferase n=1 Tax=Petromyces alliaceus TaxID=209559 RepID=UPI0012A74222|nr:acyl-CoA N-acyltransferase [Aspergillus alliaceus]KAB8234149.1 acyl-CoA N-acyltransferase [Aspergillus alliaceus]
MSLQIRYANESDSPELVRINALSFSPSVFYQNAFENVEFSALCTLKYIRSFEKFVDPKYHVLVGTDSETGQTLASMRLIIPLHLQQKSHSFIKLSEDAGRMVAEPEKYTPEGINQRVYASFLNMLKAMREKYLEKDDIVLDYLATDPEQQGKGVGTQLLKWALQKADTLNARMYLEASEVGYPLYQKHGWKLVEEIVLDFEPLGGSNKGRYYIMIRDPVAHPDQTS